MIATIIFIIGSSLCGFAQNMEQLIIFRAIQGIGAGGILPSTMTIIADVYPFEKRAKVLGFMGSAWGIAGVFGPLVGGFLVDQLSWHWIFFINVPIGILTILLILLYLREKVEHVKLPIDYSGASLFTVALLGLLFALQRAGNRSTGQNRSSLFFLPFRLCYLLLFILSKNVQKIRLCHLYYLKIQWC